ncbi:MAG: DUF5661 family protein [Anaerolineales bacterium]|jgi:hypothetical protein
MEIPTYVSNEEVQRVCSELRIRDWSQLKEPQITIREAEVIQKELGGMAELVDPLDFKKGLEVELEHGTQFPDVNVTNNHPLLTGMIVVAHLKESLDYYSRLEVAELEGDLLKALLAGDREKLARKYKNLLEAKAELADSELSSLEQ